jgi:hypothetical protein
MSAQYYEKATRMVDEEKNKVGPEREKVRCSSSYRIRELAFL